MSERHIRRLLILGMTVEVLAAIVGAYAALCALIQIGAWLAEHIPDWAIPPMIVSVPLIGIVAMAWDSARTGRRRTIRGFRMTLERRVGEK